MGVKNLLPIGSVIRVRDAEKRMMIIGVLPVSEDTQYDYIGVLYPEGYLSEEELYLFYHDDIEDISFLGYADIEHQAFRINLDYIVEDVINSDRTEEQEE